MYSYVIRVSLVCTRMSSVYHSYVVLPWTISDIPGNADNNAPEEAVLNLFSKVNVPVNRLKTTNNAPSKVIAKRKNVFKVLKAKKPCFKNADLTGTGIPPGTSNSAQVLQILMVEI